MTDAWRAPEVERTSAGLHLDERAALEQWLDYHRTTLLMKCAGLTEEQLKEASVPPSALTLLGLVRHMTEVERQWFRIHAGNEDMPYTYSSRENPDGDFNVENADAESDLEAFRNEIEEARAAVRAKGLDEVVPSHGEDPREHFDIRWIYLHMIEEYARHNGHADLLRERIDGRTGD